MYPNGHLYNLRSSPQYRKKVFHYEKTRPAKVWIGERRKPAPNGVPGYLRLDTVHQGDGPDGKGLYHLNAVDEVTQWEIVAATPFISYRYLLPALEDLLRQLPFPIKGFHSGNGSELINRTVEELLNKLLIDQTKSRARHSGDNGLVETKNVALRTQHSHVIIAYQKKPPRCSMPQRNSEQGVLDAVPLEAVPTPVEDALGALKSIAEVGSLFVALSFVGGWSFMASYYLSFGIDPSELDFSVPATSAFAVHMLRRFGWPLVLAALLFIGLAFFYGKLGAARRAWGGACVAILIFAVAAAGSARGRTLAAEDVLDTSPRLPNVGFVSKVAAQEPNCLARGTTDCKLLLHSKGAYYFFKPIHGTAHGRNVELYMVPDSEISLTKLVRGLE